MGAVAAWLGSFRSLLADAPDQRRLLNGVLGEHTKLQGQDRGVKARALVIKGCLFTLYHAQTSTV